MREIEPAFQAQLESGATTHCRCWRIDRKFGDPLGFTDHDRNITFEGVVFEASSGFAAGEIERSLGLAVDNGAASGALRSDKISERDIQSGAYDGAEVRQWVVDWRDPANRLLTFRGELGEIRRGDSAFEVELRGLTERLNRPVGRDFLHVCDAQLGDSRCRFDLSAPGYESAAVVTGAPDARTLTVNGLSGFDDGWFDDGVLTMTSGVLAGRRFGIATQRSAPGGEAAIMLTADLSIAPEAGDALEVVAGCDKRIETCRSKFANVANFRGFPFIPGDSWVAAYPVEGGDYDGGSLG